MMNLDTPLKQILDDEKGLEVLKKHLGQFLDNPMLNMAKAMTLNQISVLAAGKFPPELLEKIKVDLEVI